MDKFEKFEVRSEQIDAILGKVPSKLILNSTSVIFGFILLILTGTMFVPYPEQIECKFVITSSNPPIQLFSETSGQVIFYVLDKENVRAGQILASISNPASLSDVIFLERNIDSLINEGNNYQRLKNLKLGELTNAYLELEKSLVDYAHFKSLDYLAQKTQKLNQEIIEVFHRKDLLANQLNILEDDYRIANTQYQRDSILYEKGIIPTIELEATKNLLNNKKNACINSRILYKNDLIQLEQLKVSKLDLEIGEKQQLQLLKNNIRNGIEILKSEIEKWRKKYVFISPYDGIASFALLWSDNQWVEIATPIMTILPIGEKKIIGRMEIPIKSSGKIKKNQIVVLKLSNYPYMEFGVLHGLIQSISLTPYNKSYISEIEIDNLITNYGYQIPFSQQMEGTANIIVKDISLFERLLQPIIYALKGYK